jgi:hypothetical protein
MVLLASSFQELTASAIPQDAGDTMYIIVERDGAAADDAFYVDAVTLVETP